MVQLVRRFIVVLNRWPGTLLHHSKVVRIMLGLLLYFATLVCYLILFIPCYINTVTFETSSDILASHERTEHYVAEEYRNVEPHVVIGSVQSGDVELEWSLNRYKVWMMR